MTVVVKYVDAFKAGVCGTGSRREFTAVGLNWKQFVITGYTAEELYAAFGKDHPTVNRVIEHMKAEKSRG